MELINVYSSNLNDYTLREWVLENMLHIGINFTDFEEAYERIVSDTGLGYQDIIDTLNEKQLPSEEFYVKMNDAYGLDPYHIWRFFIVEQYEQELRNIRRANLDKVLEKEKSQRQHDDWFRQGRSRQKDMEIVGRIIAETVGEIKDYDDLHIVRELVRKELGVSEGMARLRVQHYKIWKEAVDKNGGPIENTYENCVMLFLEGKTLYEVEAITGMNTTTGRKIRKELERPLDVKD